MRVLVSVLGAASLAAPAFAQHFTADYAGSPTAPVVIADISIGSELAAKGDDYGHREFDRLIRTLTADLERELRTSSLLADESSAATLHVVIEDATPNRPTFAQQGVSGLSWQSYGRGGAHVTAQLRGADGAVLASYDYSWTTPSIQDARYASVWTDTYRTFDRFAARLADSLEDTVNSGS
jgi:predicted RNase H-like nuclease